MTKKLGLERTIVALGWGDLDKSLDEFLAELNAIRADAILDGFKNLKTSLIKEECYDSFHDCHYDTTLLYIKGTRDETDEEYKKRLDKEEKDKEMIEKRDREIYEKIKNKYNL